MTKVTSPVHEIEEILAKFPHYGHRKVYYLLAYRGRGIGMNAVKAIVAAIKARS